MKKILVGIFLIVIMLAAACTGNQFSVRILDGKSLLPVEGSVSVNGKAKTLEDGLIKLPAGNFEIEKEGYGKGYISLSGDNGDTVTYLEPLAYIVIVEDFTNVSVLIDGVQRTPAVRGGVSYISPVSPGKHRVTFEKPFFKMKVIEVDIFEGENKISVNLEVEKDKVIALLSSIKFPEDLNIFSFDIGITGTVGEEKVFYDFEGKAENGNIVEIKDVSLVYTYKNNTFFLNEERVTDPEQIAILQFAMKTIQEFMQLKPKIQELTIVDVLTNTIKFESTKEFEERPLKEAITLSIDGEKVNAFLLEVNSEELKADINISVSIR